MFLELPFAVSFRVLYVYVHSIVILHICMSLFESTLLIFVLFVANPRRNWTFERFARVVEKERTQRNK